MSNTVIFQYNNVEKPYLLLRYDDGNRISNIGFISLNKEDLQDDLPIYDDLVVEIDRFLISKHLERENALFVLNCKQTTKITTTVPNVAERKTRKIYETEILNKMPNIDDYDRLTTSNDTPTGKVYYDFLTDKKYRSYFETFGKGLGFENVSVEYLYSYLFNNISNKTDSKDFVYFHDERDIVSLLVCINGELSAYASFESNEYNYRLHVSSIVDKHIVDLEKANLSKIISNKKIAFLDNFNSTYSVGE